MGNVGQRLARLERDSPPLQQDSTPALLASGIATLESLGFGHFDAGTGRFLHCDLKATRIFLVEAARRGGAA